VGNEWLFDCESCEHTWWTENDPFEDDIRCPKCGYPVGWKLEFAARPVVEDIEIEEPEPWQVS